MRFVSVVSLILAVALSPAALAGDNDKLTVFTAGKIITMETALPEATAIAVANGRIVAVGNLASLQPWIDERGADINRRFEDKVLMPGFIDPHVHPSLPAILTLFPFIAPDDWRLPTGDFPGETTPEGYVARLQELVEAHYADPERDPNIPFITWGYHQLWHGEVFRDKLNALFPEQPVMLWHRSFHELIGNDAAFELLGISAADVANVNEADWARGHFWENGLMVLLPSMPFLMQPARYEAGLNNFFEMLHRGGVTSAMDMGIGIFGDPVGEQRLIRKVAEQNLVPARIVLTPIITDFLARGITPQEALAAIESWSEENSQRVRFDRHFKLMMDGAIFSGLSQYAEPGYLDGHKGQWMAPLDTTFEWAEVFWNAGYQLHAHTNGDLSTAALLDIVARLQAGKPRFDHRFALEHFAYATNDQVKRMAALGMVVSANPYYQYILADVYADKWLGPDRARNMVPLGSVKLSGMPFALHSDCPMAPLSPLTLAWTAVNRETINGNRNFQWQAISVHDALQAITTDAAWMMRMENEIGSLRAGKRADMVVLEEDPYAIEPARLKDIAIWGTVFEGKVYPVNGD